MSLPDGIVLVRPDGCYKDLFAEGVPADLAGGVQVAACSGSCVSYIGGRALQKKKPDHVIIGDDAVKAKVAGIVADELAVGGSFSAAPFDGIIWNIFLRLVREKLTDPAIMDYAADMLGQAL